MYLSIAVDYKEKARHGASGAVRAGHGVIICQSPDLTEREANAALSAASRDATKILHDMQMDFRHEYSWPDGSLYYLVRVQKRWMLDPERFRSLIPDGSNVQGIRITRELESNHEVSKAGCKTVTDYFARFPSETPVASEEP